MFTRFRYRKQRKAYREMLARWNADGGDERFRFDYPLEPESVVLDFGGYEGQWADDLYSRQRCRIHIFEPVKSFAEAISRRFEGNTDVSIHPFALGARSRMEALSIAGASSSAHKARSERIEVEFRDAKEWIEESGIENVALAKINIEGGEYELLDRLLETGLVRRFAALQIQFHYFVEDADARMESIQERLAMTHTPTWQYRYIWENWQRNESDG
jgi:FkbM family methyltransferase